MDAPERTGTQIADDLLELLGNDEAVRFTVDGYMPLVVERIGLSRDGEPLIAVSHTTTQNGDLMRDPEIVFEVHDLGRQRDALPVSFRNDFLGLYQEVCDYDENGKLAGIRPRRGASLQRFSRTWFSNLHEQGFFGPKATREVLG
jgi:hypothetical protein